MRLNGTALATMLLSPPLAHQLDTSIHVTGACQYAPYRAVAQKRTKVFDSTTLPGEEEMCQMCEHIFIDAHPLQQNKCRQLISSYM